MGAGPRVFIAGGHTYLGARVAAVCQERDFDVICLAHENQETYGLEAIGVEIVRGSILEPEGWKNVLKRCDWALNLHRHIDLGGRAPAPLGSMGRERKTVGDRLRPAEVAKRDAQRKRLRAFNVDGAVRFLDTCIALDVPKVLTISSMFALGDQRGALADEEAEHLPHFHTYFERTMYDALFQTRVRINDGAQIACVLPGPILGPHADGPFSALVEDFVRGKVPWGMTGSSQMTFTYIDDIVRGIFQIMDRRASVGLYLFGNEPVRWEEFLRKLARTAGVEPPKGWVKEERFEQNVLDAKFWGGARGRAPPVAPEILPYMVDAQYRFSSEKARGQIGWDFTTMDTWLAELVEEIKTQAEGPATQAAIETFGRASPGAG